MERKLTAKDWIAFVLVTASCSFIYVLVMTGYEAIYGSSDINQFIGNGLAVLVFITLLLSIDNYYSKHLR